MNITNQINAALNDIRATLIELSKFPEVPEYWEIQATQNKARYQLYLAMEMINDHRKGISQPWSDRKHQVEEEFS